MTEPFASKPAIAMDCACQWLLESFSYKGATVMMAPAAGFYATKGKGKNEVRLISKNKMDGNKQVNNVF